jgi:hypothetical protein
VQQDIDSSKADVVLGSIAMLMMPDPIVVLLCRKGHVQYHTCSVQSYGLHGPKHYEMKM